MKNLPWKHMKTLFKISSLKSAPSAKTTYTSSLKNRIEDANNFYKRLVGMDKVEYHRSKLINLQGQMMVAKEMLDVKKYSLMLTRHKIKRVEGEISKTDRKSQYNRFAELLNKEKLLRNEEEELALKVKIKEEERDMILTKLDSTKTTVLMLEKDHSIYHKYIKYFCSCVAFVSTGFYVSDNKKILKGIKDLQNQNQNGMTQWFGSISKGLWWGCEKGYESSKWVCGKTWNLSKTIVQYTGSGIKTGVVETYHGTKWLACAGYNQAKRLVYSGKND